MANAAVLAQHPGLEAALNTDHYIVRDIKARFERWGTLSDKQIALVLKLAAEKANPAVPAVADPSEWVGTVGERTQLTIRLENVIPCDTRWGRSYLHLFKDEKGNRFKWFGSHRLRNQCDNPIDLDAVVLVKATVKAHETYNGVKQTALSRVKLV